MTIPVSGGYTDATCRGEWGLGLPMTSEQLRAAAGLGLPYTSEQLRGLSSYDPNADAITWANISDSNIGTAGASISRTVTGLSGTISVNVSISSACSIRKNLYLTCGGSVVADATSGSSWTFNVTNGQTIGMSFGATQQYSPKQLNTLWQGTCTITNMTTGAGMGSFTFDILAEAEEIGA